MPALDKIRIASLRYREGQLNVDQYSIVLVEQLNNAYTHEILEIAEALSNLRPS